MPPTRPSIIHQFFMEFIYICILYIFLFLFTAAAELIAVLWRRNER